MNINNFKEKLLAEKAELESELKKIGNLNPNNPEDWRPTPPDLTELRADPNEMADRVEEYEQRNSMVAVLETRYNNINDALKKIEEGTYGMCEAGDKPHPIDEKRLEANPSATTCMEHSD